MSFLCSLLTTCFIISMFIVMPIVTLLFFLVFTSRSFFIILIHIVLKINLWTKSFVFQLRSLFHWSSFVFLFHLLVTLCRTVTSLSFWYGCAKRIKIKLRVFLTVNWLWSPDCQLCRVFWQRCRQFIVRDHLIWCLCLKWLRLFSWTELIVSIKSQSLMLVSFIYFYFLFELIYNLNFF